MSEINIKALIYTIITLILIPLFTYIILNNAILFLIIGIILSIMIVKILFHELYLFFDEYF